MGAGGRETEEGKKRKGERHLLNIYKWLVYVCLSIQLGLDLKLNMGISEDEIKMERSRFLTSLCSSILYKYMPKKKGQHPTPKIKKTTKSTMYTEIQVEGCLWCHYLH